VRVAGAESSNRLEVLPDPRVDISLADRIQKRNAVQAGMGLLRTLQDLRNRLQSISEGLARVDDLLEGRQDTEAQALRALADSLGEETASIDEAVAQVNRSSRIISSMASTRDAPTEAERITLAQTGESLDRVVSRFNAFLAGRLGQFLNALDDARIGVFPDLRPVQRSSGG